MGTYSMLGIMLDTGANTDVTLALNMLILYSTERDRQLMRKMFAHNYNS